ncbi:Uncharacterised protein [Chryseobacterium carnipullorum]|uniref:Uncharacterized protein n=1 Tax=Chryseobacterium carnipullorum TaxID=1124835 RepID=A0A376DQ05_CHRCU|nr:Uncharacterised protein [Chryseobacterium carnipullorum]
MGRQPDLFSSAIQQPYAPPITNRTTNGSPSNNGEKQEAIGDLFSGLNGNGQADKPADADNIPEPAPYGEQLKSFHRNDCLVLDKGWVGHLQNVDTSDGYGSIPPFAITDLAESKNRSLHCCT